MTLTTRIIVAMVVGLGLGMLAGALESGRIAAAVS